MAVAFLLHSFSCLLSYKAFHDFAVAVRDNPDGLTDEDARHLNVLWTVNTFLTGVVQLMLLVFVLSRIAKNKAQIKFETMHTMSTEAIDEEFDAKIQVEEDDVLNYELLKTEEREKAREANVSMFNVSKSTRDISANDSNFLDYLGLFVRNEALSLRLSDKPHVNYAHQLNKLYRHSFTDGSKSQL